MNQIIEIFPDVDSLSRDAAEKFAGIAGEAIEKRGRFAVALAGGSTPKALYRLLASPAFKERIDWQNVFFFLGDERSVLPDHPESNFRTANETLFKPLGIEKNKFFRWETSVGDADEIAAGYAASLEFFFRGFPRFDLILLGLGADGHTASLFPFTAALAETAKIAAANLVEKLNAWRLTLTFPVINNAENVIFLVAGAEKAGALKAVLEGEPNAEKFPAQNVRPANGALFWLTDEKAAALLKDSRS